MGRIHVAITRQIIPGKEKEFEQTLLEFARESLKFPGVLGVSLIGPVPGSTSNEYGMLRSFENEAARDAFYSSEYYLTWHQQVADLVVGMPKFRGFFGMEAFFREFGNVPPPRWKMAVATWLGVVPTSLFWGYVLPQLIGGLGLHFLINSAISGALIVSSLTWAVMPVITRLLAPWLRDKAQLQTLQQLQSQEPHA